MTLDSQRREHQQKTTSMKRITGLIIRKMAAFYKTQENHICNFSLTSFLILGQAWKKEEALKTDMKLKFYIFVCKKRMF